MRTSRTLAALAAGTTVLAGLALGSAPAAADPVGGGGAGGGGGSYTVQVTLSGNGVGHGGSLAGPPISASGGSVAVPSPCGYTVSMTQSAAEANYNNDKAYAKDVLGQLYNHDPVDNYTVSIPLLEGIIAHWGTEPDSTWYYADCNASVGEQAYNTFTDANQPVLVGPGGGPPQPARPYIDPERLLQIAERAMTLPDVTGVGHNPAGDSYVKLPTYVWVLPGWRVGETRTVTASLGTVSETVTATYRTTTFSAAGAPGSATCPNGGVRSGTPACALTFLQSSPATTINADVRWSAAATGVINRGLPGATMHGAQQVAVAEIQTYDTH